MKDGRKSEKSAKRVAGGAPSPRSEAQPSFARDGLTKFYTLEQQAATLAPSTKGSDVAAIHKLVEPHIRSFDAIQPPDGRGSGGGLLALAIEDIGAREVRDLTVPRRSESTSAVSASLKSRR